MFVALIKWKQTDGGKLDDNPQMTMVSFLILNWI